ncbi:DUF1704 domain-containing protein [Candidatus Woesebacteria bacterium]|nr:DUF1704 domain-containing protein [Candidatus Woesebacteria bacterium]
MNNILSLVKPLNLLEEKTKFFSSDSYNPQFSYTLLFTKDELQHWGLPQERLYTHALYMLTHFPLTTPVEDLITREEIEQEIEKFNQHYTLDAPIIAHFSEKYLSRCKVSPPNIYFQLPLTYSHGRFSGLYRHELETHVLRTANETLQPWHETPTAEVLLRRTEEGLANLHTHLFRKNKILHKSYFSYVATYLAQQASFRTVFDHLVQYGCTPATAWNVAVKVKRGLTDTSQPGGLTKEICYFEGTIHIWQWLMDKANDPHQLYLGRIAAEQIPELAPIAQTEGLRFPTFFADMDLYYTHTAEIGAVNNFKELL